MTQTQNHIISCHPHYDNLFIAGGGSYTHTKDLSILRENVLNLINIDSVKLEYGWDPCIYSLHNDQPLLLARGNFKDLERIAEGDTEVQKMKQVLKSLRK